MQYHLDKFNQQKYGYVDYTACQNGFDRGHSDGRCGQNFSNILEDNLYFCPILLGLISTINISSTGTFHRKRMFTYIFSSKAEIAKNNGIYGVSMWWKLSKRCTITLQETPTTRAFKISCIFAMLKNVNITATIQHGLTTYMTLWEETMTIFLLCLCNCLLGKRWISIRFLAFS